MGQCILSPRAIRDLDAISDRFLVWNVEAGERLFKAFNQKCSRLMQFPSLGKRYDWIQPRLRGLPMEGYIILYQIVDEGVEILRIVHGRQDLMQAMNEDET